MLKLLANAPKRFRRALGYSLDGLKAVFHKEESFRLEVIAFAALVVCLALSPWPLWKCLVMCAGCLLIPLVETLNSAVEDICDGISRDRQPFIKSAKDKGSLAVLLAIVINVVLLAALLVA